MVVLFPALGCDQPHSVIVAGLYPDITVNPLAQMIYKKLFVLNTLRKSSKWLKVSSLTDQLSLLF